MCVQGRGLNMRGRGKDRERERLGQGKVQRVGVSLLVEVVSGQTPNQRCLQVAIIESTGACRQNCIPKAIAE